MTETDVEQIREIRRQAFVGGSDVLPVQAKRLKFNFLDRFYCSQDQLKIVKLEPNL